MAKVTQEQINAYLEDLAATEGLVCVEYDSYINRLMLRFKLTKPEAIEAFHKYGES